METDENIRSSKNATTGNENSLTNTVVIRPFNINDRGFIYSTFLKGIFYGTDAYADVPHDTFYSYYPRILDNLLLDTNVNIRVASLAEDSDVIVGYAIIDTSEAVIHFCYIKDAWRKQGLAKMLLGKFTFNYYTHKTKPARAIAQKMQLIFNPFFLLEKYA